MRAGVAKALDPIANWPDLKALLHSQADSKAVTVSRGANLVLNASNAVLAPDLSLLQVNPVNDPTVAVPANGVLTFAVDITKPMYVTGSVSLAAAPADVRPGLRAYVLSDTTVVGAPMIYQDVPEGHTQIDFGLPGKMPAKRAPLRTWRLEPGRHYISIAGPHYRAAGIFESLGLRGLPGVPKTPKYTFAEVPDTHLPFEGGSGSAPRNVTEELTDTFRMLRKQGFAFAIISGDMANNATREEFEMVAAVVKASGGLPIYGCLGNHDVYHSSSRPDMLELLPGLFPGGKTNYVLNKPPLRFIIVDAAYWKTAGGVGGNLPADPGYSDYFPGSDSPGNGMGQAGVEWLIETLAADTTTPTVVVQHFPFLYDSVETQSGYQLVNGASEVDIETALDPIIAAAPNVVATLNGHLHFNHLYTWQNDNGDDIITLQSPAFCDWPCGYRVFRVYSDGDDVHLEWEMRLVDNMGFVVTARKTLLCSPSLSWKISTSQERDLISEPGGVKLTR